MKASNREIYLAWATLVTVLLAATYWLGEPKLKEFDRYSEVRAELEVRRLKAQALLEARESVNTSLDQIRQKLTRYPQGQDVTAELLKTLERTSQEHNLTLLDRTPEKEKSVGDLYELSIACRWEGELDALVRFLYALQEQGAILDVRQLTINPGQGRPGRLRGNFTVDYSYSRETAGTGVVKASADPGQ